VIGDDLVYFAEPMFQDGIIAQAVDTVKSQGVAYFSAAGNEVRRSYQHAFVDSGDHLYVQGLFGTEDRGVMHDFDPGSGIDYKQPITIPDGSTLYLSLQWDQPFASVSPGHGATTDLDVYLVDSNLNIVAESIDDNIKTGDPVEVLNFTPNSCLLMSCPGGTYYLIIADYTGPEPDLMKYVLFPPFNITVNKYTTDSSTLYGHANAAGAEAVGSAYYMNTPAFNNSLTAAELDYFSSAGGTPILFDKNGNSVSQIRQKPEIVGPDGVETTFFYPGDDPDGDGIPNFFGTSAATPHAVGVAALMKSANAGLSPAQIYSTLEGTAAAMTIRCQNSISCTSPISTATEGYNYDSGFGFIQADQAVGAVAGGSGGTTSPSCTLDPSPATITQGGSSTLTWTTTNATSFSIDGTPETLNGSISVSPTTTTTYTGTATASDGTTANCSAQVTVTQPTTTTLDVTLDTTLVSLTRSSSTNNSGTVGVTVSGLDGDTVNLSVSGLPSHVTASWARNPGNPVTISSGSVTEDLNLVAGKHGPAGTFQVTVTGTDQSSQKTATFTLVVNK
jgi:hypothetical protein